MREEVFRKAALRRVGKESSYPETGSAGIREKKDDMTTRNKKKP